MRSSLQKTNKKKRTTKNSTDSEFFYFEKESPQATSGISALVLQCEVFSISFLGVERNKTLFTTFPLQKNLEKIALWL